jgi:hypothetical protein
VVELIELGKVIGFDAAAVVRKFSRSWFRGLTGSVRRRQQLAGCRLQPLGKFDNQLE